MVRALVLSSFLFLSVTPALGQQPETPRYNPRRVVPFPIRPITDPTIASAADADIAGNELVIGVELNGESRAYSINQLTGPMREIINDTLGGTAIAATW